MSKSRCSLCTSAINSYREIQQIATSTNSDCDVCLLFDYLKELDHKLSYPSNVKVYPFQKSIRKTNTSKNKRTDQNISVYQYFIRELAMSSINGMNNWAKSKGRIWKFLWFLVIFACASGYGYQIFTFYTRYRSNPTIVHLQVENDGQVEFPAVTICNANR